METLKNMAKPLHPNCFNPLAGRWLMETAKEAVNLQMPVSCFNPLAGKWLMETFVKLKITYNCYKFQSPCGEIVDGNADFFGQGWRYTGFNPLAGKWLMETIFVYDIIFVGFFVSIPLRGNG